MATFYDARMNRTAVATLATLAIALSAYAPPASAASLPARSAPSGMRSIDDGGRILVGPLGNVNSPDAAFRAGLVHMRGYFGSLTLESVVRSKDGTTTMGSFGGQLGGVRISGLALSSYRPGGASQFAVLFDEQSRFAKSLPSLASRLQSVPPPAVAKAAPTKSVSSADLATEIRNVRTTSYDANDGTASARLPEGWKLKGLAEGSLIADGPDGSEVVAGLGIPCVDPRGQLYQQNLALAREMRTPRDPAAGLGVVAEYSPDPAAAYRAVAIALARSARGSLQFTSITEKTIPAPGGMHGAEVTGTSVQNGKSLRFDELVGVGPLGQYGAYQITVTGVVAPEARFVTDEPEMGATLAGYHLNQAQRYAQVQSNIAAGWAASRAGIANMNATTARDQATVNASMQNARAAQDGIDRSTAGFVKYLNGSDVVQRSDGTHLDVSAGTSQALQSFDPQHYTSVPVSQYVKGVDY